MPSNVTDRLTSVATVVVTVLAISVAALRVRDEFFPRTVDENAPVHVANWKQYGSAGQRSGPTKPAVTIVEFADFQCPFCSRAATYLDSVRAKHPDDIAVVYRHYPVHAQATPAAFAAECAADVGAFRSIHDLFFQHRDSSGKRSWGSFASAAGVSDTVAFAACMSRPEIASRVARDTLAAHALGVHGTPTFVINDLQVAGFPGAETLDKIVDAALAKAKQ